MEEMIEDDIYPIDFQTKYPRIISLYLEVDLSTLIILNEFNIHFKVNIK